jgi:hypothetical protein
MLMRHAQHSCDDTCPISTLAIAMIGAAFGTLLQRATGAAHRGATRRLRARDRAVAIASIAGAAETEFGTAQRAAPLDEQLQRALLARNWTAPLRPCDCTDTSLRLLEAAGGCTPRRFFSSGSPIS